LVLSGAERQKRFRERLKAIAREGVTPEMIVEAARVVHCDDPEANHPDVREWPDYLRWINRKGNRKHWTGALPSFDTSDPETVEFVRESYGDDADLILKVSAVVRAVTKPPAAEGA